MKKIFLAFCWWGLNPRALFLIAVSSLLHLCFHFQPAEEDDLNFCLDSTIALCRICRTTKSSSVSGWFFMASSMANIWSSRDMVFLRCFSAALYCASLFSSIRFSEISSSMRESESRLSWFSAVTPFRISLNFLQSAQYFYSRQPQRQSPFGYTAATDTKKGTQVGMDDRLLAFIMVVCRV